MLKSLFGSLLVAALLCAGAEKDPKDGWRPTPLMRTVNPDEAKPGAVLEITGEYLDKARVAEIYLTTGEDNFKLEITAQAETKATVKVPDSMKPGRFRLMVLTTGLEPQFLEQPLIVQIR